MTSAGHPGLRSRVHGLCALALHGAPSSDTLAGARALAAEAHEEGAHELALALEPLAGAGVPEEDPRRVQQDFHDLFTVPGGRYLQPYESVHIDAPPTPADGKAPRPLNYGPSTVAVRRLYERVGLRVSPEYTELPDFAGLELACLEYVLWREAQALAAGDAALAGSMREARGAFVRDHLGRWLPGLMARMEALAATEFHRRVARSVGGLLALEGRADAVRT